MLNRRTIIKACWNSLRTIAILFLNNIRATKSKAISTVYNNQCHEREQRSSCTKRAVSRTARSDSRGAASVQKNLQIGREEHATDTTNEQQCLKHLLNLPLASSWIAHCSKSFVTTVEMGLYSYTYSINFAFGVWKIDFMIFFALHSTS